MTARKTLSGLLRAAAVNCSQSALGFFVIAESNWIFNARLRKAKTSRDWHWHRCSVPLVICACVLRARRETPVRAQLSSARCLCGLFKRLFSPLLVIHSYGLSLIAVGWVGRYRGSTFKGGLDWISSCQTVCSELTRTAGVSVEILQEGQEGVRGDTVNGHHSTAGLSVLPAKHGRHDVTASHQHGPVGRQHAP